MTELWGATWLSLVLRTVAAVGLLGQAIQYAIGDLDLVTRPWVVVACLCLLGLVSAVEKGRRDVLAERERRSREG